MNPASRSPGYLFPFASFISRLERASLIYLALPVVLWTAMWLKVVFTIPVLLGLGWAGWMIVRRGTLPWNAAAAASAPRLPSLWTLLAIAGVALLWALYAGAGGFTYQNPDWEKHSAILRDLIEAPWPVALQIQDKPTPLVYYLAYYLPAALVGKALGWWWACAFLWLWTATGIFLAVTWFTLLIGRHFILAAVFFVFANGLDFVGQRLVSDGAIPGGTDHIDWWAGWVFLCYPGHASQLAWAPQHSLAAWIVTGLIAVQLSWRRDINRYGFFVALTTLWSPFTFIGLLPILGVAALLHRGRGCLHPINLIGAVLVGISVLYFGSTASTAPRGWQWGQFDFHLYANRFLLFHLLEWGIFFLFARELRRSQDPSLRILFWAVAATLFAITFYRIGLYNDWCMRVSIPSLFLLWAGTARSLFRPPFTIETKLVALLVFLGMLGSFPELLRSFSTERFNPPPLEEQAHVVNIDPSIAHQYLGRKNSFFFTHLARTNEAIPVRPE